MKNDKDINNSLSNIKKALRDKKEVNLNKENTNDYFLLENVIKKKPLHKTSSVGLENKIKEENIRKVYEKKALKQTDSIKKNKIRKDKTQQSKKLASKKNPVETVINKEVKPIIEKWIRKNLRTFVKKVVVEEFKVISKVAFKQSTTNK